MPVFTQDFVEKLAQLAKLKISQEEALHFMNDLSNTVKMIEQITTIDTENTSVLSPASNFLKPYLREDRVTEINQRDIFQKNAPDHQAGLYLVPQFVE